MTKFKICTSLKLVITLFFVLVISSLSASAKEDGHGSPCYRVEDCRKDSFLQCNSKGKCSCSRVETWEDGKCRLLANVECKIKENRCTRNAECTLSGPHRNSRQRDQQDTGSCHCKHSDEPDEENLCPNIGRSNARSFSTFSFILILVPPFMLTLFNQIY